MRLLFCGGGTGGHIVPGLAVWQAVQTIAPQAEAVFLGTSREGERRFLHEAGVRHEPVYGNGRSGRVHATAFLSARRIVADLRPGLAVGLGGYASVAGIVAAKAAGVPSVLLEQNAVPGRATTMLAPVASEIFRGFDYLGRGRTVGTPVRRGIADLASLPPARCASERSLLVLGGSQGSRAVNAAVLDAVGSLREELGEFHIIHQTGPGDRDEVSSRYRSVGVTAEVVDHVDVAATLRGGPVVVSRAGGTTLAELACAGVPAVLIPHPESIRDHQRLNALHATRFGVRLCEEGTPLAPVLGTLLREPFTRARAATDLRRLAQPNAARTIAEEIVARAAARGGARRAA